MSTTTNSVDVKATPAPPVKQRTRLYFWASIVAMIVVFLGFSRTFYLKPLFDKPAMPRGIYYVHGAIMTVWVLLFVVQTWLVLAKKTKLHRKLGTAGVVVAIAALVSGVWAAVLSAKLGRAPNPGPPPLQFLAIPIFDMLNFTLLVALGIAYRYRIETHKRLMLVANLSILGAAIARIPVIDTLGPLAFFGLTDLFILVCVIADALRHRRLHPAFAWSAAFVILSHPARLIIMGTDAWMNFATWLTR